MGVAVQISSLVRLVVLPPQPSGESGKRLRGRWRTDQSLISGDFSHKGYALSGGDFFPCLRQISLLLCSSGFVIRED